MCDQSNKLTLHFNDKHHHNYCSNTSDNEIERVISLFKNINLQESTHSLEKERIQELDDSVGIVGKSHWCQVRSIGREGVAVDLFIENDHSFTQPIILQNITMLWSDFPKELQQLPVDEIVNIALHRFLLGAVFKVLVKKIEDGILYLTPSKYPHPRFSLNSSALFSPSLRCPFDYLVVIDFEATCDYDISPKVTTETAEIIEFPWVVIDTVTCQIVDKYQTFVRPDFMEGITYYCTKLTGITSSHVEHAPTLSETLRMFENYIQKFVFCENKKKFCIVTDGIWDLQIQLRREAERKRICLSQWFDQYFDIKDEFRKCFPFFPSSWCPTLQQMLNALCLPFIGNPHHGIDDALNIASIVQCLLRIGHSFDIPKTIPHDYQPQNDPEFVDFGSTVEPDAWKCPNSKCAVWNRPWLSECRFCRSKK